MVCPADIVVSVISVASSAKLAVVGNHLLRGASSDAAVKVTDSTTVLYIDLVVINNTTVGLATGGDHLGYHQ